MLILSVIPKLSPQD